MTACCGEYGCRRSQPILIRRNQSGVWFAITRYKVLDEDTGQVRADQRHPLPPEVSAVLEAAHQASLEVNRG